MQMNINSNAVINIIVILFNCRKWRVSLI